MYTVCVCVCEWKEEDDVCLVAGACCSWEHLERASNEDFLSVVGCRFAGEIFGVLFSQADQCQ